MEWFKTSNHFKSKQLLLKSIILSIPFNTQRKYQTWKYDTENFYKIHRRATTQVDMLGKNYAIESTVYKKKEPNFTSWSEYDLMVLVQ